MKPLSKYELFDSPGWTLAVITIFFFLLLFVDIILWFEICKTGIFKPLKDRPKVYLLTISWGKCLISYINWLYV
jgi:hypothetical protein